MRTWIIGSEASCDITLDDSAISRTHCRLAEQRNGQFSLEDLNSTNGTFVDGKRIATKQSVTRENRITLAGGIPFPWPPEKSARRPDQKITIGASRDNDFVIDRPVVSSQHAVLEVTANGIQLRDLDSSNGTFVGSADKRIQFTTVQTSDKLYFGTHQVMVSEILRQCPANRPKQPRSDQSRPSRSHSSRPQNRDSPTVVVGTTPSTFPHALVLWAGVVMALLIGAWLLMGQAPAPVAVVSPVQGDEDIVLHESPTEGSADEGSAKPRSKNLPREKVVSEERDSKQESKPGPANVKPMVRNPNDSGRNSNAVKTIQESVYLVTMQAPESTHRFCLGNAVAVGSNHFVTSATVIEAIDNSKASGFGSLVLAQPGQAGERAIANWGVHPLYGKLRPKLDEIRDLLAEVVEGKASSGSKVALAQKRELLPKLFQLRYALAAVNVGWMIRDGSPTVKWSKSSRNPLVSASNARVKQEFHMMGYPIDTDDPFYEASFPVELASFRTRAEAPLSIGGEPSGWKLTDPNSESTFLEGFPAVNKRNQIVGIVSSRFVAQVGQPPACGFVETVEIERMLSRL